MAFVDSLAVMLLAVAMSAAFIAYYLVGIAKGKKMDSLAGPIFMLGIFDFLSGFYMSFFWPLPGAYNMLFGDPMLMLGIIMIAGGFAIYKNTDGRPISLIGFFLGIYLFAESYGMVAYHLEAGAELLPALGFYLVSGLSGFLSPLVYLKSKNNNKKAYYLLAALLVLVVLAAMFIGTAAIIGHLSSPP